MPSAVSWILKALPIGVELKLLPSAIKDSVYTSDLMYIREVKHVRSVHMVKL